MSNSFTEPSWKRAYRSGRSYTSTPCFPRRSSRLSYGNSHPRNVTDAADPPRPERKERPTFNVDQTRMFLESSRGDRWKALYVLVVQTGLCRGELVGLRWHDVNLDIR